MGNCGLALTTPRARCCPSSAASSRPTGHSGAVEGSPIDHSSDRAPRCPYWRRPAAKSSASSVPCAGGLVTWSYDACVVPKLSASAVRSGWLGSVISRGVRGHPRCSQSAATPRSAPATNAAGTSCGMSDGSAVSEVSSAAVEARMLGEMREERRQCRIQAGRRSWTWRRPRPTRARPGSGRRTSSGSHRL
jgi:hypothetical protein